MEEVYYGNWNSVLTTLFDLDSDLLSEMKERTHLKNGADLSLPSVYVNCVLYEGM